MKLSIAVGEVTKSVELNEEILSEALLSAILNNFLGLEVQVEALQKENLVQEITDFVTKANKDSQVCAVGVPIIFEVQEDTAVEIKPKSTGRKSKKLTQDIPAEAAPKPRIALVDLMKLISEQVKNNKLTSGQILELLKTNDLPSIYDLHDHPDKMDEIYKLIEQAGAEDND